MSVSTISPILYCPLFSENDLNPQVRINKMVNKHTVDYHPIPSQLISRIYPLIFLWIPKGFISQESFLNFFVNLYIPPWLWKSFKFIVLWLLQIHFSIKIFKLFDFTHAPNINLTKFLLLSPKQMRIAHSPRTAFSEDIFSWTKKGEKDYGVEKMTKINKGIGNKFW